MKQAILFAVAIALPYGAHAAEKPAAAAAPAAKEMTVTGEVVDAACYIIHAGSGPGHKACATDCAHKGVPLAILNDSDSTFYFPSDGNVKLMDMIAERVTVTGKVTHHDEKMSMSMPAGKKGHMNVDIDGGYEVIEVATVAKAAGSPIKK